MNTILLDENLSYGLRHYFPQGTVVHSAVWAELGGWKNGALIQAAAERGYGGLLTMDLDMPLELNLGKLPLALIVVNPPNATTEAIGKIISREVSAAIKTGLEKKLYRYGKPMRRDKEIALTAKLDLECGNER